MCPSSATVTSFFTFTAGTKAKATEMNTNLTNFRGFFVPINSDTQTASDNTHDLGSTDHRWRYLYVTNQPVIGTQTSNSFWAGPSTGTGDAPAFRALHGLDMPGLIKVFAYFNYI